MYIVSVSLSKTWYELYFRSDATCKQESLNYAISEKVDFLKVKNAVLSKK